MIAVRVTVIFAALVGGIGQACSPDVSAPARSDARVVKVLVLNFDPSSAGRPLHVVLNWQDPRALARGYAEDVRAASAGTVDLQIAAWRDIDGFPRKADGFRYSVDQYLHNSRDGRGWHQPDLADYRALLAEHGVASGIDAGHFEEVWLFGGPYFGFHESAMAGAGAFVINGGVYEDVPVRRPFAIMGFNYERGVAEMLENLCHRTEDTMRRVYGGWRADTLNHNWARFAANQAQSGSAAVGSCHWPPNAEREYDWDNVRLVPSTADAWLEYPVLASKTTAVNRDTWGGPDYARKYFRWWFSHLPRAAGVNADGRLNHWWKYVFEFVDYDEDGTRRASSPPK